MERSAWPKNLSSSCKRAIQELLDGQDPMKKIKHLFDAHSRTGDNTAQPSIAEDPIVDVLRSFSNTLSPSSSAAESYEVLQVPSNACVKSEVSDGSESIKSPPVPTNAGVTSEVSEGSESMHTPVPRICAGCDAEIGIGRFFYCMGSVWHPGCFRCHACNHPISEYEFSVWRNRPYHKSCWKERHHPRCDVCKSYIPTNAAGLIEYRQRPFGLQKYCPSHERDGTPQCCSCERMEPRDTRYLSLDDGRKLCLECLDKAIMDTNECQRLYLEIREFYEV